MAFNLGKELEVMYQVNRIKRNLNKIVDKVSGPVKETMISQAGLIAGEMKRVVSVGTSQDERAGSLRDSIRVEEGEGNSKQAIVVKIKAGGRKTINDGESHAYDYARANEFGTTEMHARPFFYPTYNARKKDARTAIRKRIKEEVFKVFD